MRWANLWAAICVVVFNVGAASAQWIGPPVLVPMPLVDLPQLHRDARKGGSNKEPQVEPSFRRHAADPMTLHFTPSLPQRRQNFASFIAIAQTQSTDSGASLTTLFNAGDIIETTTGVITPLGLRADNVADALTFYMLSHWMAVNKTADVPGRSAVLGLRGQMERNLLTSRQFEKSSNAEKQKTAEGMLISSLLMVGALAGAQGNAEQTAVVADRAAQNVKGMGLDLATLELGPNGFEVVK